MFKGPVRTRGLLHGSDTSTHKEFHMVCEYREAPHEVAQEVTGMYEPESGEGYRLVRCKHEDTFFGPSLDHIRVDILDYTQSEQRGTPPSVKFSVIFEFQQCRPPSPDDATQADVDEAWRVLVAHPYVLEAMKDMPYSMVIFPNGEARTKAGSLVMF